MFNMCCSWTSELIELRFYIGWSVNFVCQHIGCVRLRSFCLLHSFSLSFLLCKNSPFCFDQFLRGRLLLFHSNYFLIADWPESRNSGCDRFTLWSNNNTLLLWNARLWNLTVLNEPIRFGEIIIFIIKLKIRVKILQL